MAKQVKLTEQGLASISDQFADELISHTVDLLRVAENTRESVVVNLEQLAEELEAKITDRTMTSVQQARVKSLLRQANNAIASAYRTNGSILKDSLLELADFEGAWVPKMMNRVFRADIVTGRLTKKDLIELATDSMIQGAPQKDWWAKQSRDLQNRFATQMRMGIMAGETNDQLVSRLRGRRTGRTRILRDVDGQKVKIPETVGGVMDISKRDATNLVRTAAQTVSNNVIHKTYEENQDVLGGEQALATLDTRTSPICRARDKAVWDFKGNPLPSSKVKIQFPGPPPWHFGCRTTLVPITKSWEELTGIEGLDEVPESTRASMDGQVAGGQTYEQWLKKQSIDRQLDVLGPGRHKLWTNGDVTLGDMIDPSGRSLTLAELQDETS